MTIELGLLAIAGLAVATIAGIGAVVLQHFSRRELEEFCRWQGNETLYGEILDHHDRSALGAEALKSIGIAMLLVAVTQAVVASAAGGAPGWMLAALIAGGSLALMTATIWIPWAVVELWSGPFLFYTWRFWTWIYVLLTPLGVGVWLVRGFMRRLAGQATDEERDEEEEFEDEIRAIVSEGERDGHLDADAREMIEGVIELGDRDVADIMRPRNEIEAVSIDMPWDELIEFVVECRRTRIPVYRESLDTVIGVLYVKDLLAVLAGEDVRSASLRSMIRPARIVPESKRASDLLREFLQQHTHLAIVQDEFRRTAGLITLEDMLEEIVGEIVDESDPPEESPDIDPHQDGSYLVRGRTHIWDLNEELALRLPEEEQEYDTLGGMFMAHLGRVPKTGDQLEFDGVRLTVVDATSRRVERVRVEPAARVNGRAN